MQINLGCGFDRRDGYLNVDSWPECSPDLLFDLEQFPWPFETSSVTRILACHVLEHLGADLATFRALSQELYRISAPGCLLGIHLPYCKSVEFWSDPTHVRVYTPLTLQMLSKARNLEWIQTSTGNTKLAMMFGVDFEVVSSRVIWDYPWNQRLESREISLEQLLEVERHSWNVVKELQFDLMVRKGDLA